MLVYEFSILEPVTNNDEFIEKVKEPVYPTFWSLFNIKRLYLCGVIAKFAYSGYFMKTGRYRIEIKQKHFKINVILSRTI